MRRPFFISIVISIAIGCIIGFFSKNIFWGIASVITTQLLFTFYGASYIRSGFFIKTLHRIPSGKMQLMLSFDDGPDEFTPGIIQVLKKHGVKAHFFLIGNKVKKDPELVSELYSEGHTLGNHTYCHQGNFYFWSSAEMLDDIQQANKLLENITHQPVTYFRPPFGVTNPSLAKAIIKTGMLTVGWSFRTLDTVKKTNKKMEKNILANIKDGDIILFHDTTPGIVFFLDMLIPKLKEKGFNFVLL